MQRREVFPSFSRPLRVVLFGLIAVVAAGWGVWMMTHGSRIAPPEPPLERTTRQVREQLGTGAELRYSEIGQKRAVCGYVGRTRGGAAVGFISLPNRILFSDDPLPAEFRDMRDRHCPGFLITPPRR
ncbi:hypothetical protein [uncultured Brevundimonas sp.]|uniref:hypothetical protein n=1 Tax=uncultured Brevundimonas sp. TaxID=213418 RepID=UPI00260D86AA|nr:hypothetical protein [uncultured Brevundimonas sp.]